MIWAVIALGSPVFWGLFGSLALFAIVAAGFENYGTSVLTLIVTAILAFALIDGFSFVAMWSWAVANWPTLAIGFGAYLALGVAYSFIRWIRFVYRLIARYKEELQRKEIYAGHKLSGDSIAELKRHYSIPPQASNNKARIIGWMIWWPANFMFNFIKDPIYQIFNWIYNNLGRFYQNVADRIVARSLAE